MRDLQEEFGSALIIITHDLGVVAELADDIVVMYGGRAIEYAASTDVFDRPQHPYTWGLLVRCHGWTGSGRSGSFRSRVPAVADNLPPGCAFHPRCTYADVPAD